ncbi:MAG: restriction endonuclease [Defluviitaleaceae bacterium]|nr:restriction endonuclease [Defluviitaleaceae bacterium]
MAMPNFQEIMLPVLKFLSNGETHSFRKVLEHVEIFFALTEQDKQSRVPSGLQRTIYNRTSWAVTYLRKANLIVTHGKRGNYKITAEGQKLLSQNPPNITTKTLKNYENFQKTAAKAAAEPDNKSDNKPVSEFEDSANLEETGKTPQEIMGLLAEQLNLQLAQDLLEEICANTPTFFEKLVVDLLLKMGYGGLEGSGEVTKKTGDGGIDGIIKQDELGLEMIYIQAKKWDKSTKISAPEVQKFVGALAGEKAAKGVFITTSSFSKPAIDFAESLQSNKIILVDGLMLAKFMIKHNLGVSTSETFLIKKIDVDYFDEQ